MTDDLWFVPPLRAPETMCWIKAVVMTFVIRILYLEDTALAKHLRYRTGTASPFGLREDVGPH